MSLGLFFFLVAISIPFDVIGMFPFLGFVIALLFMIIVKTQLHMHGYERSLMRSIIILIGTALLELIIAPWPSALWYSVISFLLNKWDLHKEQKAEQTA